eukprot:355651-Prorocentrum_minimum.AAC.8
MCMSAALTKPPPAAAVVARVSFGRRELFVDELFLTRSLVCGLENCFGIVLESVSQVRKNAFGE